MWSWRRRNRLNNRPVVKPTPIIRLIILIFSGMFGLPFLSPLMVIVISDLVISALFAVKIRNPEKVRTTWIRLLPGGTFTDISALKI